EKDTLQPAQAHGAHHTTSRVEGLKGLRLPVLLGDVLEPRVLRQEDHLHGADRSVALLADDDFRDVLLVRRQVFLVLRAPGEEEDDVRVLLEGARIMAADSVRQPRRRPGHGEVEDELLASGRKADNPVPEKIARRGRSKLVIVKKITVLAPEKRDPLIRPALGSDRFRKRTGDREAIPNSELSNGCPTAT